MPDNKRNLRAQKERALRMIKKRQPRYQDRGISRKIAHSMSVLLNSSLPFSTIRRVSLNINTQGSGILFRNSEKMFAPLCRRKPPRRQPIQTTSTPQAYKLAPLEYLKTPGSHSKSVATRTQRRTAPVPDFDFNLSPIRPIRLPYRPGYYTWPNHDSCLPVRFSSLVKVWHGVNLKRPVNNQEERSFAVQKALARLLDANAATQRQKQASRDACTNLEYSDAKVVEHNEQEGSEFTNADYENWTIHAVSPEKNTPLVSLWPVLSTPSDVRTSQIERELTEATRKSSSSSELSPPTPSCPSPYNYSEIHPSFSPPYLAGHSPASRNYQVQKGFVYQEEFDESLCQEDLPSSFSHASALRSLLEPASLYIDDFRANASWGEADIIETESEKDVPTPGDQESQASGTPSASCSEPTLDDDNNNGEDLKAEAEEKRKGADLQQQDPVKESNKAVVPPAVADKGSRSIHSSIEVSSPIQQTTSEQHERPIDTLIGKDQTDQLESATTSGGLREQEAHHRTSLERPDQSQLLKHHQAVYQDTARQSLIQQPDPVTHVIAGALDTLMLLLSALALVVSAVFVAMVTIGLAALFEDGARLLVYALS